MHWARLLEWVLWLTALAAIGVAIFVLPHWVG